MAPSQLRLGSARAPPLVGGVAAGVLVTNPLLTRRLLLTSTGTPA